MLLSFTLGHVSGASLVTEREAAGEAETSWDLRASEPGWRSAGELLGGPGRVAPPAWRAQGAPRARAGRGGAERGAGASGRAADTKQSRAPWRLSTITFN